MAYNTQSMKNIYYEAARNAHYDFFERICNPEDEISSRKRIENIYNPDSTMVNLDVFSGRLRVNMIRDFTCYANYYQDIESPVFQFGDDGFQLSYKPQNNQPGNAAYIKLARLDDDKQAVSKEWTVNDILNLEIFAQLEVETIASLVRESRQTGIPVTAANVLERGGEPIDSATAALRRQAQSYASELNHLSLFWDFEIARHLQRPSNNYARRFTEIPFGIGVAIVLQMCSPFLGNAKDKNIIRGIFSGCSPIERAGLLKELIADYINRILRKRNPRINYNNHNEVKKAFDNLLLDEFGSYWQ